ncbi:MAG: cardiolipin synthase [Lachnospiraceae bacterium]|nr:cardiolipin synthase [Lachnospiraceae bacterium]
MIIQWIGQNLIYINMLLAIIIIFFERREPRTVWAWLLVLYFIPVLGFVLYLVLGQNMHKKRMFRIKEIEDEVNSQIRSQTEEVQHEISATESYRMKSYQELIYYNLNTSGNVYTDDNDITIYTDGNEKFDALISAMESAKKYIHIQYYIIRNDALFERIKEVLIRKVKEGVEVRILYDGMGCREIRKKQWRMLRSQGIETAEFFPAVLKKAHLRINYRNHRKIVVVDGEIGFVGGFNVGNEYLGLNKKFGYWRDTHIKITGSAVLALQIRFLLDWNYAANKNLFLEDRYFTQNTINKGTTGIQIISSGPDSKWATVRDDYVYLISHATDHIYIQTPYFVPDETMLVTLKMAAASGVDVRIMIPCKPDHPFVYWATYSYIGEMLQAGAKCYTYDNGFLHTKGICIDGKVCSYGTANFDIRSFYLNFEVNAVIFDEEVTKKFEQIFLKDIEKSTSINMHMYNNRSLWIKFKEQFSRLLSPIL